MWLPDVCGVHIPSADMPPALYLHVVSNSFKLVEFVSSGGSSS